MPGNYVKQVATELNDVFSEITAQYATEGNPQPMFAEDLSNFIDVGYMITSSQAWSTNFDEYVGKYIHRIGKTVFADKDYKSDAPDIELSGFEYGALLQKIRVGEIEFKENPAWNLQPGQSYPYFDFNPVDGTAKYFESKVTYAAEWSWAAKQLKSAFTSLSDLMKLRNAIIKKISIKKNMASDALKWRLVNGLNAINLVRGKVVNILEEYNNEVGQSLTAAQARTDKEFLRFLSMRLKMWKEFIARPTRAMNPDGELNWTPKSNLKICMLSDIEGLLDSYLYSDTFHKEFVEFEGYKSTASWQALDSDFSYDVRSAIMCKTPDDDNVTVNFNGIIGCYFDREAMAIYNEEPEEMSAPMNPKGKFVNYYYSYDCSYFLDTAEPSVTFIISDYSPYRGVEPDDWATSTNKYYAMSSEVIGDMTAINTTTVTFEQAKVNGIFVKI